MNSFNCSFFVEKVVSGTCMSYVSKKVQVCGKRTEKRVATHITCRIFFGAIFDEQSKKWHPKRHPNIDAEKVSKNEDFFFQNNAKTRSPSNDTSMDFRNLRFLVFCEVSNVKIFFYMIRRPRIPLQNDKISMQFRCSKNV